MKAQPTKRESSLGTMVARSSVWTGASRGLTIGGIGALMVMLNQQYVSKEIFDANHRASERDAVRVEASIRQDIKVVDDKLTGAIRRLDNIEAELRTMNRKTREAIMAIPERER